jgi:hypothetical protein
VDWVVISLLSAAILLVSLISGALALRQTRDTERGSLPGKGDHIIEANYSSGAGGGGHSTTYRIPKDPQEYAKRFVPKERRK